MPGTEDGAPADVGDVVMRLVLRPGELVRGSLDIPGQCVSRAFSGWIDLMGAINAVREQFGLTETGPPSRTQ